MIGLIGTAPNADAAKFPINTPVLIAGRRGEAAPLGVSGTLPAAVDDIFDQAGAMIVVMRVADGVSEAETLSNIIGGVDPDTGQYQGVQAFLAAESEVHLTPRILIAPEFSHNTALVSEMLGIAERLRAVIIADGPNTQDTDAITYRGNFGSPRVFLVDPWVRVWDTYSPPPVHALPD
ncbi:Phage major tail sheath protein [methanotrophic bacterial endosymbiont of Bathymodiolus sp.]|nr:Phage major tail sheath protein [methanotrophic bacterial endosymbiont of Bathymodiolus sp.]